jgi:hypothetical protein
MGDSLDDLRTASRDEVLDAIDDAFHGTDELDETEIQVIYEPRNDEMGCTIRLFGAVGTETERQIASQIITDVLGLPDVDNRLRVDEASREDAPYYNKPVHEDTDYIGEALEVLDGGTINDELGYAPPDRPIAETTTPYEEPSGREGRK